MRLLGEHAHNRFTRPHLRGHREGRDWSTSFRTEDLSVRDGVLTLSARDEHAGLRLTFELESLAGRRPARPPHAHQRRSRQLLAGRARGRAARAGPPHRGPGLHRPARARAHAATPRRHRRAVAAGGPRRPARARRRDHVRASGHPASPPPRVRSSASTSAGAATPSSASSGTPPPGPPSVEASSSSPGRWSWPRARRTRPRGSTSPPRTTVWTGWPRPGTPGSASLASHPERAAGRPERLGGRLLRPRPLPAARHRGPRGPGRGRAVRPRRRLVPAPPRRHRRAGRLVGRRVGLARRPGPAGRARPRPRHGVRPVVRARDGQPRLRPLPRPPGLGPQRRCPAAAARAAPAGPRPDPAGGPRLPVRPGERRARRAPDRLREVGPQPRPARGRDRPAGRRSRGARADPRLLRSSSTPCGRATRRSPGSPAPRAADASTSVSSRRCSASGAPT